MGGDRSQAEFDIFLCYSESEEDKKFADILIKEWNEEGLVVRTPMDQPRTPGYNMIDFLQSFKGKFLFITICSQELFTCPTVGWFDGYLDYKLSEDSVEASNAFPDVVVIPIMRMAEDKIAAKYSRPSCREWNAINSCIGPSNVAKLVKRAFDHIKGLPQKLQLTLNIVIHT